MSSHIASMIFVLLTLLFCANAYAQVHGMVRIDTISVTVNFKQGQSKLKPQYMGNDSSLLHLAQIIKNEPIERSSIHIIGFASPEGSHTINEKLAAKRAEAISQYLQTEFKIPADHITTKAIGVDWEGVYLDVLADRRVPMRDKVLDIIRTVTDYTDAGHWTGARTSQLKELDKGTTWNYLLRHIFPYIRGAKAMILCPVNVPIEQPAPIEEPSPMEIGVVDKAFEILEVEEDTQAVPIQKREPFWSLHTNMLLDLAAVPNIGAELYLGKNFSIAANWWYAWWKKDRKHRYWRTYGGYIAPRYWFGKAAAAKPLTGHHIGLYGQILLYDFEWGGIGYLSGTPHRNIFHHPTWGGGIEYGFALPIKRRLNIDFTIGLGYLKGRYWKYEPLDNGYRWISLHNLNWWGPTKIEVSLVWLLGDINYNVKKGGKR